MPEGDTLALAATRLREALGGKLVELSGSARAVARERSRFRERRVLDVTSLGKHLLVHFDNEWILRTHLGMTGAWHVYGPGERWRVTPGKARVVIDAGDQTAVCFAVPTVELGPASVVERSLAHLGPDLMAAELDIDDIVARAATAPGPTAADLLLDQRVMAGVGNVYKSEVLFLERIDPHAPVDDLDPGTIRRLAGTAARLLGANADTPVRSTTGVRRRGSRTWVYDRARRPCRRCGDTIVTDTHGDLQRVTYWCPTCQRGRS